MAMRALVCDKPGILTLREVEQPVPGPGEARIRVAATGVCGSDVKGYHGTHPEIPAYPIILGHEFAGTVDAIGPGVEGLEPGTRVAVEPLFVCGKCRRCLQGDYHVCVKRELNGHHRPGSFAEWTVSPARFCHPIPDDLDSETAALAEPAAVAVHVANRARPRLGDVAVLMGMGPIGLLVLQTLKLSGCRVIATDIVDSKVRLAAELGADVALNATERDVGETVADLTEGDGADLVVETAGARQTLAQTVRLVRTGGTVVIVGFTGAPEDPFGVSDVMGKELNVIGSVIYAHRDFPDAIRLLSSGAIRGAPLITHRSNLDGLADLVVAAEDKSSGMLKPMCVIE